MEPTFFPNPESFRAWLTAHHATAPECLVGFWKVTSGKPSMTWPQSVDQALAYGWIDGVRRRIDDEAYSIRFTPRRAMSIWSQVNLRRFDELDAARLIEPAGRAAHAANQGRTHRYAYENDLAEFTPAELKAFKADRAAWKDWAGRPPHYRKVVTHWVVRAKKPETRARRLAILIEDSAAGRMVGPMKVGRTP